MPGFGRAFLWALYRSITTTLKTNETNRYPADTPAARPGGTIAVRFKSTRNIEKDHHGPFALSPLERHLV